MERKEDLEKFSKKNSIRQATWQDSVPSEEHECGGNNENLMYLENGEEVSVARSRAGEKRGNSCQMIMSNSSGEEGGGGQIGEDLECQAKKLGPRSGGSV